jgi:hypothetical protein
VPAPRACHQQEDALGDRLEVLDRRRRPAGDADDPRAREGRRVGQVVDALDLDRGCPGDLAQPGQFLRVRARPSADDDHQVHLSGRLEGVLLTTDRDRADGVDDLELMGASDHERGEALELPGRLRGLADERHPLAPRDGRLPLVLIVHDALDGTVDVAEAAGVALLLYEDGSLGTPIPGVQAEEVAAVD